METINVNLSNNPYKVLIDNKLLESVNNYIPQGKCFVITDNNIDEAGWTKYFNYEKIVLPAGEENKSFKTYQKVAETILNKGITRKDFLIALGGGVIGDLTGFLASTLLRGIDFIQIPTSLMAMVDSSVGGKTGINTDAGKNLIGTFHQPKMVLIDINVLSSLDERNLKAGYTEGVKHGLIGDLEYFEWCEKNGKDCINRNYEKLKYFVKKSVEFKTKIVLEDEFETKGIRALLNLGHTFAHVYEKSTNYNPDLLLHGEAVGLGIRKVFLLSEKMGMLKHNEIERVLKHFKELDLLDFDKFKDVSVDFLIENMKKDKKTTNTLNLVLNKKIGESVFVKGIDEKLIKEL